MRTRGKLSVAVGDVMRVLKTLWREKTETASRLRGLTTARRLDSLLPARSKVAKVEHLAALPWRQIGSFITALSALALRFAILTAARTGG